MPPSIPTTSLVAVATARILAAYLSNHKLSPTEAANLSGEIAEALASLVHGGRVQGETSATLAERTGPRRQAKPRRPRRTSVTLEPGAPTFEPVLEPEPVDERAVDADQEPEEASARAPEANPVPQAEAADTAEWPSKRKRPSRPRSRRGKGGAPASEALSGEAPEDEEPHDNSSASGTTAAPPEAGPEVEVAPDIVADEVAPEGPAGAAKPRRKTSRARRVKAS